MKVVPRNNILCIKLRDSVENTTDNGITLQKEYIPIFQIIQINNAPTSFEFKVGDKIMTSSTGTEIKFSDTEKYYLFDFDKVACSII